MDAIKDDVDVLKANEEEVSSRTRWNICIRRGDPEGAAKRRRRYQRQHDKSSGDKKPGGLAIAIQ